MSVLHGRKRGGYGRPRGGLVAGSVAVLWVGPLLGACTFEFRGEEEVPALSAGAVEAVDEVDVRAAALSSAIRTTELFRSAVASGDLSRALALVDREATLVDALVGETATEAATRGELLLELRRLHSEGMHLESIETTVDLLGSSAALVRSYLAVLTVRDGGLGEEEARLHETVVLIAHPEGWRILRLHRSLESGEPGPSPL